MNQSDKTRRYLEALHAGGKDLTDWEKNFLSSVARQFNAKGAISDRQFEIVERIYNEKTPVGSCFGIEPADDIVRRGIDRLSEGHESHDRPGISSLKRRWREDYDE